MVTTKRKRKPTSTKDKVIVYSILAAIFFVGFVVGRVSNYPKTDDLKMKETIFTAELTNKDLPKTIATETVRSNEPTVYFDCPLSEQTQDYIFELCEEEDIPPSLVIAVIDHESRFDEKAISSTSDYGLMQINECNHEWLSETYGITDFLDPKQNILCGVKILSNLYHKYDNPHDVAMAYNMGEYGAATARENGTTSTPYSEDVVSLWIKYEADHETAVRRGKSKNSSLPKQKTVLEVVLENLMNMSWN